MDSVISKDRKLHIATGASRWAKLWKNQEVLWSDFAKRLKMASETGETPAQYQHMTVANYYYKSLKRVYRRAREF